MNTRSMSWALGALMAILFVLFPSVAVAAAPYGSHGPIIQSPKGGVETEVGDHCDYKTVLNDLKKVYQDSTGEPLTVEVLQAANASITWTACLHPPPFGRRSSVKGNTAGWEGCAPEDHRLILEAGTKIHLPTNRVETNAEAEAFKADLSAKARANDAAGVLKAVQDHENAFKKAKDPNVSLQMSGQPASADAADVSALKAELAKMTAERDEAKRASAPPGQPQVVRTLPASEWWFAILNLICIGFLGFIAINATTKARRSGERVKELLLQNSKTDRKLIAATKEAADNQQALSVARKAAGNVEKVRGEYDEKFAQKDREIAKLRDTGKKQLTFIDELLRNYGVISGTEPRDIDELRATVAPFVDRRRQWFDYLRAQSGFRPATSADEYTALLEYASNWMDAKSRQINKLLHGGSDVKVEVESTFVALMDQFFAAFDSQRERNQTLLSRVEKLGKIFEETHKVTLELAETNGWIAETEAKRPIFKKRKSDAPPNSARERRATAILEGRDAQLADKVLLRTQLEKRMGELQNELLQALKALGFSKLLDNPFLSAARDELTSTTEELGRLRGAYHAISTLIIDRQVERDGLSEDILNLRAEKRDAEGLDARIRRFLEPVLAEIGIDPNRPFEELLDGSGENGLKDLLTQLVGDKRTIVRELESCKKTIEALTGKLEELSPAPSEGALAQALKPPSVMPEAQDLLGAMSSELTSELNNVRVPMPAQRQTLRGIPGTTGASDAIVSSWFNQTETMLANMNPLEGIKLDSVERLSVLDRLLKRTVRLGMDLVQKAKESASYADPDTLTRIDRMRVADLSWFISEFPLAASTAEPIPA